MPDNLFYGGERPSLRLGCLILSKDAGLLYGSLETISQPRSTDVDVLLNKYRTEPKLAENHKNHDKPSECGHQIVTIYSKHTVSMENRKRQRKRNMIMTFRKAINIVKLTFTSM